MPTIEKAASEYTEYVKRRASVIGRREFSDSLFNSLILQSSVGKGLGNKPEGPPVPPPVGGDYGVLTGFDNPDKVLWYPNFGDPGDFTVEFFFKCWDVNHYQNLWVLVSNEGSDGVGMCVQHGILFIQIPFNYISITSVTQNTWYHVGLTRNGSNWYVSINGTTFQVDLGTLDLSGSNLCIGNFAPDLYPFFSGSISNFRISGPIYTTGTYTIPSAPLSASGAKLLLLANPGAEFVDSTGTYISQYSCGWEAGPIPSIAQPRTDYGVLTGFGRNSGLTYPGFGISGDFTMECFFKSSDPANANYEPICFFETGTYIGILVDSGYICVDTSSGSEGPIQIAPIEANTWYHFALTRSSESNFYTSINGQTSLNTDIKDSDIYGTNFYVGWLGGPNYFTSGSISNLRVSGVAKYTSTEGYTVPTVPMSPASTDLLLLLAKPDGPFADTVDTTVSQPRAPRVSDTNCGWAPGPIGSLTTDYGVLTGFDTDSALTYTEFGISGDFTIECFFKLSDTANAGYEPICHNIDVNNNNYIGILVYGGGYIYIDTVGSGGSSWTLVAPIEANTWYHVALTRSGSNFYTSINGQTSLNTDIRDSDISAADFYVGYNGSEYFTSGSISNLRVSNYAKYTSTEGYTVPTVPMSPASTDLLLLLAKPDGPFADTVDTTVSQPRTPKDSDTNCKWGPGPIVAPITDYGVFRGFDTNSVLTYPEFGISGDFTMECFFKSSDPANANYEPICFFEINTEFYVYIGILVDSGYIVVDTGSSWATVAPIEANTWYHVALTRSSGSNFYTSINGQTSLNTDIQDSDISGTNFYVGWYGGPNYFTSGSISNLRVSNYAKYTKNFYQVPTVPMTPASTDLLLLLAQPNAKFVDSSTFHRTSDSTCEWGPGEPIVV